VKNHIVIDPLDEGGAGEEAEVSAEARNFFPGWGGAMLANQFLDQSAPRERFTQVEGSRRTNRSKWNFAVALAPWGASGRSVYIGSNLNGHPGQRWIVRTRSGHFGYEWVESAQPAPDI